ncbi:hypothetical protein L9F63_007423, partial [Diploptera punctata]
MFMLCLIKRAKKMRATIVCAILFIHVSLSASIQNRMVIHCEEDHECDKGHFCYHTGYCVECTECSVYYRQEPKYSSCPKKALECGDCLTGYKEDILLDGQRRDSCIFKQTPEENNPSFINSNSVIAYVIIALLVIIIIILISIFSYFCYSNRRRNKEHNLIISSSRNVNVPNDCDASGETEDGNISIHVNSNAHSGRTAAQRPPPYDNIPPSAPFLNISERAVGEQPPSFRNISLTTPLLHVS